MKSVNIAVGITFVAICIGLLVSRRSAQFVLNLPDHGFRWRLRTIAEYRLVGAQKYVYAAARLAVGAWLIYCGI
jgi:hypothetical protein